MMKSATRLATCTLGTVFLLGTVAAMAQDLPQYRDNRTGSVWTPQWVNEDAAVPSSSSASVNRAFNPNAQNVQVEGIVVQNPRAHLLGTVPITAGPTVPIATLDAPSLQIVPGRNWLSVLYLTNNSSTTVDAVADCHFTNGGRKVEDTRIVIPPAGPGERLGVAVRGPRYDIFVDRVTCQLMSPT
jgi:hypothetical protein